MSSYKYHKVDKPRGIAVVIHGFNLNPRKMEDFVMFFNDLQMDALNVTLAGHEGNGEHLDEPSKERWKQDTWEAFEFAINLSKKKKIPFYFLGYSTGALTGNLIMLEKQVRPDKQFLFAPALGMRNYVPLGKILGRASIPKSLIPDINYKNYRAETYLKPCFYNAFFSLYDEWLEASGKSFLEFPTYIYTRQEDEMISLTKLRNIIKDNHFDKWQIHQLNKAKKFPMQHVVVDQESIEDDWGIVINKMRTILESAL